MTANPPTRSVAPALATVVGDMGAGGFQEQQHERGAPTTAGPAPAAPVSSPRASLLQLQRAAGNGAVNALLQRQADPAAPPLDVDDVAQRLLQREPEAAPAPSGYEQQKGELYAPEMLDIGAKGVDKVAAEADLQVLALRLAKVPALADTDFLLFMREYVQASAANDPTGALDSMYAAIACLDSVGAFTVAGKHYAKLGAKPDQAWIAEQRAKAWPACTCGRSSTSTTRSTR